MARPIRILSWEGAETALKRAKEALAAEGVACEWREVDSSGDVEQALERDEPDVVLADSTRPGSSDLLDVVRKKLPGAICLSLPGSRAEGWEALVRQAVRDALGRQRLGSLEEGLKRVEAALNDGEAKYQALFQGVNDAVLVLRGDVVVDCNTRASAMFHAGREQLVGNSYVSFLPPTQPGGVSSTFRIRKLMDRAAQGNAQCARLLHRRLPGGDFHAELNLRLVNLSDQRFLLAVVQDVTGQKQAEEAKSELESRLRQAQKMESMGTLAGGIAHDFNNILGAIIGYTHLAKEDAAHLPEVLENLRAVEQASKRARDLVQQILAFSRHDEPERKSIQLQGVLEDAIRFLRASLPSSVVIETSIDPGTGPVLADRTQIHQVVLNLAANAAHSMNQQGTLKIGLKEVEVDAALAQSYPELLPGSHARLTITDTGCGMDRQTQQRIFDPFFTTKPPGEGTGLGLAVVHGIINSHDGIVTLQSAVGKGSTFRIYLPVRGQGEGQPQADTVLTTRGGRQRILFVDDEPSLAKVGKKLLERLGYQVTICCDSMEAVELFRADPARFDLVITDQTMPRMEGSEMSRRMLEIRPGIPIVLTTGYTSRITPEQSRAMGIREMLLKPLSGAALGNAVERVMSETGRL